RVVSPWRAKSKSLLANSAISCSLFCSVMLISLSCELRNLPNGRLNRLGGPIATEASNWSVEVRNNNGGLADVISRPPPSNRRSFLRHIRVQSRLLGQRKFISARSI